MLEFKYSSEGFRRVKLDQDSDYYGVLAPYALHETNMKVLPNNKMEDLYVDI